MVQAARLHGKNYAKIAEEMGSKTRGQVAKFANDLYHKAVSLPEGSMPNQEFIKETFKPYGLLPQVHIMTLDDQQKFVTAVRKYGKNWERLGLETGKDRALLELFSKLLLAKIDENPSDGLQDIADILRGGDSSTKTTELEQSQPTM